MAASGSGFGRRSSTSARCRVQKWSTAAAVMRSSSERVILDSGSVHARRVGRRRSRWAEPEAGPELAPAVANCVVLEKADVCKGELSLRAGGKRCAAR